MTRDWKRRDERRQEREAAHGEMIRKEVARRRDNPTSRERMLDALEGLRVNGSGPHIHRGEFEGLLEIVRCSLTEEEYYG